MDNVRKRAKRIVEGQIGEIAGSISRYVRGGSDDESKVIHAYLLLETEGLDLQIATFVKEYLGLSYSQSVIHNRQDDVVRAEARLSPFSHLHRQAAVLESALKLCDLGTWKEPFAIARDRVICDIAHEEAIKILKSVW